MRIAIVTLPLHTNYGGILQAYALQTVLQRMGCEVEHLQMKVTSLHPKWKMPFVWCKRFFRKYFGGERTLFVFDQTLRSIRKNTDIFINSYINVKYLRHNQWNHICLNSYDAFIFGSDQIWRPLYAWPLERYFGDFIVTSSIKKIAYAASFGTDKKEYTLEQIHRCSYLLSKFKAVSVREFSAVSICSEYFGIEASQVLDPTLLLDKKDYIELFLKSRTPLSNGTLGVYLLDENEMTNVFIDNFSQKKGLIPFRMGTKTEDVKVSIVERRQPPVEQWLRAFYDADFIVTDSFHGTVFSIRFHKPFVCVGNDNRGMARFNSLLKLFGLEDRLVDISDINNLSLNDIDWTLVDEVLSQKRKESIYYLESSLS